MLVTWFLSQKGIFDRQFDGFFNESFKLWCSCIALVSDSETAFLRFENSFLIICFCVLKFFFLVFVFLFLCILLFFCVV